MSMVLPERIERKYEPYPEYRYSGVEWLAKVPTQWNIIRLKYGVNLINDKVENGESDTPYLGLENVESWTGRIIETDFKPEIEGASNSFLKDDVLFGKLRPYLAKAVHAQYHGICTSELMVLRPQKYYSRFLFYYMLSPSTVNIIDSSTYGVKMPRANWHFIGNLPVVVPPMPEQQTIADFLDREITRIDGLIARKQRLIELLQEQRTALITHAVTKGLNPDVLMKDSGVEWLGEIPMQWELKKLKYVSKIVLGKMLESSDKGDHNKKPYLRAQNILWEKVDDSDVKEMWFSDYELIQYRIELNDLLVSEGGEVGRTAIWRNELEECYIQNSVHKVTMRRDNVPFYFLYQFLAHGQSGHFDAIVNRVSIAHLTREKLKEVCFLVPPSHEQQAIADYLDQETFRIDSLIGRINQAIEKLQEYRSTLITAAVTGKIDVRAKGAVYD